MGSANEVCLDCVRWPHSRRPVLSVMDDKMIKCEHLLNTHKSDILNYFA